MKITNVRVTPVNIPLEIPFLWTAGLYPGTSKTIIEVETDDGLVGLGEAPSSHLVPAVESLRPEAHLHQRNSVYRLELHVLQKAFAFVHVMRPQTNLMQDIQSQQL